MLSICQPKDNFEMTLWEGTLLQASIDPWTKRPIHLYEEKPCINIKVDFLIACIGGGIPVQVQPENMSVYTSHVQNIEKTPPQMEILLL